MEIDFSSWAGRSETRRDVVLAGPIERLSATLDRDDPVLGPGEVAPPLAHWLHFLPSELQSQLGCDGHARRGGFLPPVDDLPRRMWAGSRITFTRPLRVGAEIERTSAIAAVAPKQGSMDRLVLVTVRHEIAVPGEDAAVIDEHDIVYRGMQSPAAKPADPAGEGRWRRAVVPDPVMLFRYSALTFNGHRIHYDRPYATEVEGYPGLVVHGPLIATLLLDLARRQLPEAWFAAYSFRAASAAFDGEPLGLHGEPPDADGSIRLWATKPGGGLVMRAEARLERAG